MAIIEQGIEVPHIFEVYAVKPIVNPDILSIGKRFMSKPEFRESPGWFGHNGGDWTISWSYFDFTRRKCLFHWRDLLVSISYQGDGEPDAPWVVDWSGCEDARHFQPNSISLTTHQLLSAFGICNAKFDSLKMDETTGLAKCFIRSPDLYHFHN